MCVCVCVYIQTDVLTVARQTIGPFRVCVVVCALACVCAYVRRCVRVSVYVYACMHAHTKRDVSSVASRKIQTP